MFEIYHLVVEMAKALVMLLAVWAGQSSQLRELGT